MARNEDGEFELMLGNKQLLSVFFLIVLLLCLCFVGGYLLGRSAAPVLSAANQPAPQPSPAFTPTPTPVESKPEPAKAVETAPAPTPEPSAKAPIRTAPQVSEKAPEPAKEPPPAPKQAKTAPPAPKQVAAKQAPKQGPATGQPVSGRVYLQLSATDKDKAEVMVEMLRRKNFAGVAAPVTERPGLFRVLVGPLAENALTQTKAQLKANGFPGDEAIRRVF